MGILIITWNFPPRRGGIESMMARLHAALGRTHSVQLVTSCGSQADNEPKVFRAPLPGLLPFLIYALWRGSCVLKRSRATRVIFGGSVLVTPIVLLLARIFHRRAIIQAHGLDVIYSSVLYQTFCVRWMRYCDRLIANSSYTASLLVDRGVPRHRICVIP